MGLKACITTVFPELDIMIHLSDEWLGLVINDELEQLEGIFDMNLKLLKKFSLDFEPVEDFNRHYELSLDIDKVSSEELDTRKKIMHKIKNRWLKSDLKPMNDWISTTELENLITLFLKNLQSNPNFYNLMKFNFSWGEKYFEFNEGSYDKKYPVKYPTNLIEDLLQIQRFLKTVKEIGHKYVVFFTC